MNWLDIVIVITIAISTILGVKTGLITAVLSLAGLVVGVILAGRYYALFSEQLTFIPSDSVAKIVAFAIILVAVLIIARLTATLLKKFISLLMLGWVDRVAGAIFGLVMGALLCSAVLALWIEYLGIADAVTESRLAILFLERLPLVLALLPDEFDSVRSFFW